MATRSRTAVQVRRTRRKDGSATETYSVRWADPSGARRRRTFREREHAEALAARIDYLAYRDELGELVAGDATVASFVPDWEADARSRIAESTVDSYVSLWVRLLAPRFGRVPLRRVTARDIAAHKRRMLADGVGAETARRALVVLQSIFALAVEWDEVSVNPVKSVRKPKGQPIGAAKPVAPPVVEAMRAAFLERGDRRSATMISLLAYAGPRPGEMLALRVSDIRARTLLIERAVAGGQIKRVKTGRLYRTVDLLAPLRDDLETYIQATGLQATDLLFPDRETGDVWQPSDWANWRKRVFRPVALPAGVDGVRPYDLRHSFVSLLIREQRHSVIEIAEQLGHAPTMTLNTYGHVFAEYRGTEPVPAAELIEQARRAAADRDR